MGFFLFAPCFPWHTVFFFTLSICSLSHCQDLYLTPLSPSIYNKIVTEIITMLALKLFYQLDRALQRGLCSPQWHSHWAQPSTHEGFPLYTQAFTSIAIVLMVSILSARMASKEALALPSSRAKRSSGITGMPAFI